MPLMNTPQEIINAARKAADAAGDKWMTDALSKGPKYSIVDSFTNQHLGTMLDSCGNAHLQFKDKRTANYKAFKKANLTRSSGVICIGDKFQSYQEYGLHMACATAAKAIFLQYGILDIRIFEYID